jgi:hypothetical protein
MPEGAYKPYAIAPSVKKNGALLHFLGYISSSTITMFEYESSDSAMSKDALFLERLDTFMDKCLIDIKAFAERELRPYQEVF